MGLNESTQPLQGMASDFMRMLPSLLIALLVYAIFHAVAWGVRHAISGMRKGEVRQKRGVRLGLGRLVEGGIILLGVGVALTIAVPSFNPTQLLELLGIGGVAVGFAFREILQNFLAGILILLTEPFRINDQIIVGEFEGTIEMIQTRATLIRTYDGRRVVVPNAKLITDGVTVNTAFETRRLECFINIVYGDDIATAKAIILAALCVEDSPVNEPEPSVLVVELAPSGVLMQVRWWIDNSRRSAVNESTDRVLTAIKNGLQENGIVVPYPTTRVLLDDRTERDGE